MAQQHESLIGEVIDGRYRLAQFLGEGAFAWVYAADEISLGGVVGQVAVKLLRPQDEASGEAVQREARALARLDHPNILRFRRCGTVNDGDARGALFICMELASETLRDRLRHLQRLQVEEVYLLAEQVASALAYLAERKAVHRDVKPENILRVGDAWKLGDFGLIRGLDGSRLSRTGRKGTLFYMSPEQCTGVGLGPATDVWALGVILQECLTGDLPYAGSTDAEYVRSVMEREPHVASSLHEPLASVVRGCLVKDPQKRWTAGQVAAAPRGGSPASPIRPCDRAGATPPLPRVVAPAPPVPGIARSGEVRISPRDGAEMVYVPVGEFMMGSDPRPYDEVLQPKVYLDGFWMYRHPVAVAQYRRFCSETGRKMPMPPSWGWKEDHPIVNVTWDDAKAYADWAGVALPTEAQWEKAAGGTDGRVYPWGNTFDASKAVCSVWSRRSSTAPVGSIPAGASPYGCLDMAGNVWEWCSTPRARVVCGGCWRNKVEESLAIGRFISEAAIRRLHHIVGLRCVAQRIQHVLGEPTASS